MFTGISVPEDLERLTDTAMVGAIYRAALHFRVTGVRCSAICPGTSVAHMVANNAVR